MTTSVLPFSRPLAHVLPRTGSLTTPPRVVRPEQKVYSIIHPDRRNLTAIRGYRRIGGLPDDPHTDPQDRTWCASAPALSARGPED